MVLQLQKPKPGHVTYRRSIKGTRVEIQRDKTRRKHSTCTSFYNKIAAARMDFSLRDNLPCMLASKKGWEYAY